MWLIDTGLRKDRDTLLEALAGLGIATEQVRVVLLTHGHCDHAGNAAYFQREFGSDIYAHTQEIPYLNPSKTRYGAAGAAALMRPLQSLAFRAAERMYPVERIAECTQLIAGDSLTAPGRDLEVIHCPGHSPGHIAFFQRDGGLLFSGDAVMHIVPHVVPRLRHVGLSLPLRLFSSDWDMAKKSARQLALLRPELLAAGHGPVLADDTAARLAAWADTI